MPRRYSEHEVDEAVLESQNPAGPARARPTTWGAATMSDTKAGLWRVVTEDDLNWGHIFTDDGLLIEDVDLGEIQEAVATHNAVVEQADALRATNAELVTALENELAIAEDDIRDMCRDMHPGKIEEYVTESVRCKRLRAALDKAKGRGGAGEPAPPPGRAAE